MAKKHTITQLPLAPNLTHFLKPDPACPEVATAMHLSDRTHGSAGSSLPSNMRRSRQLREGAHFSYVTPLPLAFPYRIPDEEVPDPPLRKVSGEQVGDGTESVDNAEAKSKDVSNYDKTPSTNQVLDVETFLASLEPSLEHPIASSSKLYTSPSRRKAVGRAQLIALSESCARDVLPDLDFTSEAGKEELLQLLSGRTVFADEEARFAPWSLRYGGHQFGVWAGQLGDGRAISVFTTPSPSSSSDGTFYPPVAELQLKGAGRTPFSRFADGLAVLRSSVREFLGSEALAALGIPTSRALSLISLPDIPVMREQLEYAAIVCRVAPSWLRIGSFEILRDREEWDSLLLLARYVSTHVLGLPKLSAAGIIKEVSERNAKTFAAWQAYGFMHGVLNTDNISLLGLTIDYGPYAFMDIFDPQHICNHSDEMGRYSYRMQPTMGVFAVAKLGDAIAELIGAELDSGEADIEPGWASRVDRAKREEWRHRGLEVISDVKRDFTRTFTAHYKHLMRRRLGMGQEKDEDFAEIFDVLLDLMEQQKLDYSRTLRSLCAFDGTNAEQILDEMKRGGAPRRGWEQWLAKYAERLSASPAERRKVNPRFVLRQWVLEEAIKRCDKEPEFLRLVLEMALAPFDEYTTGEQARLCEIGDQRYQGFQCSCSS